MNVTKLVLPVAGLGKRLRPLTLRQPKALVPLNGGPLLDYVLKEGVLSGIREVILVISPQHERHFKRYLKNHAGDFKGLKFHIRRQERPLGNGHAVIQAADILKKEPFAVRFCDDLLVDRPTALGRMMAFYRRHAAPILLLERVPERLVSRYGVVGVKTSPFEIRGSKKGSVFRITEIVEKPKPSRAPSNLTIVGGYVLSPSILNNLTKIADSLPAAANDALPIAVAFQVELMTGGKIFGWEFDGRRLDCGTLDGFRSAESFLEKFSESD